MPPNPPRGGQKTHNPYYKIEPVKQRFQGVALVPFFTKFLPCISETQTPREGSQERINDEPCQIHFRNTSGKGDKCSNDRQQPAAEDDQFTAPRKPPVGEIQIVL